MDKEVSIDNNNVDTIKVGMIIKDASSIEDKCFVVHQTSYKTNGMLDYIVTHNCADSSVASRRSRGYLIDNCYILEPEWTKITEENYHYLAVGCVCKDVSDFLIKNITSSGVTCVYKYKTEYIPKSKDRLIRACYVRTKDLQKQVNIGRFATGGTVEQTRPRSIAPYADSTVTKMNIDFAKAEEAIHHMYVLSKLPEKNKEEEMDKVRLIVDVTKIANGFNVNFNGGDATTSTYMAKNVAEVEGFVGKAVKKMLVDKNVKNKKIVEVDEEAFLD